MTIYYDRYLPCPKKNYLIAMPQTELFNCHAPNRIISQQRLGERHVNVTNQSRNDHNIIYNYDNQNINI